MIFTVYLQAFDIHLESATKYFQQSWVESFESSLTTIDHINMFKALDRIKIVKSISTDIFCNTMKAMYDNTDTNIGFYVCGEDITHKKNVCVTLSKNDLERELDEIQKKYIPYVYNEANDKAWSMILKTFNAKNAPRYYILKDENYIKEARLIYLCGDFLQQYPEYTKSILSKIKKHKLAFNLTRGFELASIDKEFLKKIISKSKIIIGDRFMMESLRCTLYSKKYHNVSIMINKKSRKGRIFFSTSNANRILFAKNGKYDHIHSKMHLMMSLDTTGINEYIAAGFISKYYDGTEDLESCALVGCRWARNHNDI